MIISLIAAASENNVIGFENKLPWKNIAEDKKFFLKKTLNHTVIMGRKTFESIKIPLKNRRNIIISRNKSLKISNAEVVSSIKEALDLCSNESEVFIVGGSEIYKQAILIADKIYLTRIYEIFEGDTFFPEIDLKIWKEVNCINFEKNNLRNYSFSFITYERED